MHELLSSALQHARMFSHCNGLPVSSCCALLPAHFSAFGRATRADCLAPLGALRKQVGRYGNGVFDFSAERVTASVRESLARLQLSYVDLIQTHDIEFGSLDQVRACMFACFPFSGVLLML